MKVGLSVTYCPAITHTHTHTPSIRRTDWLIAWVSGYYVLNHASLPSSQSLFAQLWKEYALSDSRYLTSDPFMLCIETLTVVIFLPLSPFTNLSYHHPSHLTNELVIKNRTQLTWGPLSLLAALLAAGTGGGGRGTRHLVQAVVCVGHLYGVALYYGTCGLAARLRGVSHSRPEALYYWVYYAGMNAPWAIVPSGEYYFVSFFFLSAIP